MLQSSPTPAQYLYRNLVSVLCGQFRSAFACSSPLALCMFDQLTRTQTVLQHTSRALKTGTLSGTPFISLSSYLLFRGPFIFWQSMNENDQMLCVGVEISVEVPKLMCRRTESWSWIVCCYTYCCFALSLSSIDMPSSHRHC